MAIMLTDKIPQTQVKNGLWRTDGNQLCLLDNGKIAIVPKNFLTDNITFIDNDFADVRASHFHDVGCKYHKMVYVGLSVAELRKRGYLKTVKGKWVCEDIPIKFLYVQDVGFKEINDIFKQCLESCYVGNVKRNIMYCAVFLNIGWLKDLAKFKIFGAPELNTYRFYAEEW